VVKQKSDALKMCIAGPGALSFSLYLSFAQKITALVTRVHNQHGQK
jgi:hypothetical protein